MANKVRDEYYLLTEILEELDWALGGSCNDIDCDKYMYKNFLKKKYKPVFNHSFSCLKGLNRDKAAVMRLLSLPKFRKFRYEKCSVCKRQLDKLDSSSHIVAFTRRSIRDKKYFEMESVWVHKKCKKFVKIPEGWKKF